MSRTRLWALLLLLAAVAIAAAGCGGDGDGGSAEGGGSGTTVQQGGAKGQTPPGGKQQGGTAHFNLATDTDYVDPALAYYQISWQHEYATCAKLLNYPDSAGAKGSQLVPEVAQALPKVSPDGRTYTFTIRKGFKFSPPSNEEVTAETFKYAINRDLNPKMQSPAAQFVSDIVGAQAVIDGKALVRALKKKRIAGAGLDVFENEPKLPPALKTMKNVVLTPHLGSAVMEVREQMANIVVDNLQALINGGTPPNCVNPEALAK